MRSISRLLADTLAHRLPVRLKITSRGSHFFVSAWPCFTVTDACCTPKSRVRKTNKLHLTMDSRKKLLYGLRCDSITDVQKSELTQVMPDVVAYVRSLNERVSTPETRNFVVYL